MIKVMVQNGAITISVTSSKYRINMLNIQNKVKLKVKKKTLKVLRSKFFCSGIDEKRKEILPNIYRKKLL